MNKLNFYEFLSRNMTFYEYTLISLNKHKFLWINTNFYEFLSINMNFYEFLSINMNFYEFLSTNMNCLWICNMKFLLTFKLWTNSACGRRRHAVAWAEGAKGRRGGDSELLWSTQRRTTVATGRRWQRGPGSGCGGRCGGCRRRNYLELKLLNFL